MQRQTNLRKQTNEEIGRYREIQFYVIMRALLDDDTARAKLIETIECLCLLCNANITVIKSLVQQIFLQSDGVVPTKQELAVALYRNNIPVRKIRVLSGIHPDSMYIYLKQYIDQGQPEYQKKLNEIQHREVAKFMKKVYNINTIFSIVGDETHDEYSIR